MFFGSIGIVLKPLIYNALEQKVPSENTVFCAAKLKLLYIGQSGNDKTIFLSITIFQEDSSVGCDKWNKRIASAIEGLGFKL